jgi:hypothetical protein
MPDDQSKLKCDKSVTLDENVTSITGTPGVGLRQRDPTPGVPVKATYLLKWVQVNEGAHRYLSG